MNKTLAKLEAFKIKWDKAARGCLDVDELLSAEIIWWLLTRLDCAIMQRRNLMLVAERWKSTKMQPWVRMGKELSMLLKDSDI